MLAVILGGGGLLWYLQAGAPVKDIAVTTSPPTTQPISKQPPATQPVTDKPPVKPSAESLLLEAGRKFTNDPEGAQKLLEEALTFEPNNYDCSLSLARLHAFRKDYPAAIQQYEQALRLDNRAADVHFELGSLYLAQSNWDAAIQTFEACLMLMPRNRDDVLANLGFCHFKKGNFTQAQLLLKQSLEVNPNNATAKTFMASLPPQPTTPPTTQQTTPQPTVRTTTTTQPPVQQSKVPPTTPPTKEIAPPSGPKLEGNYLVEGTNPNGTKYKGGAVIKRNGDKFFITWNIANQVFNGNGTLAGKTLRVNWKSSSNTSGTVVYGLTANGVLKGSWSNGKGTEMLTPVN